MARKITSATRRHPGYTDPWAGEPVVRVASGQLVPVRRQCPGEPLGLPRGRAFVARLCYGCDGLGDPLTYSFFVARSEWTVNWELWVRMTDWVSGPRPAYLDFQIAECPSDGVRANVAAEAMLRYLWSAPDDDGWSQAHGGAEVRRTGVLDRGRVYAILEEAVAARCD